VRCDVHLTAEDQERIAAMDAALLHAGELEEEWLAALRVALTAERNAGVRRADAPTDDHTEET